MAKRKNRVNRVKKIGRQPYNYCPYCDNQVKQTFYMLNGAGFFIEHLYNDKICAVFPFPTACGLNEFLKQSNVYDVWRDKFS